MERRELLYLGALSFIASRAYAGGYPEYPVELVGSYQASKSKNGLAVAALPLDDKVEQQRYFSLEFRPKGFLPVFIVLSNESPERSYIVKTDDITIATGDEEPSSKGDSGIVSGRSKAGEGLLIASGIALSLAGSLVAAHMMVKAAAVKQNIIKKELRSLTLSPGQTAHGFLYVPVTKGPGTREKLRLRLRGLSVGADEPVDITLAF